jgi:hypothetical protein
MIEKYLDPVEDPLQNCLEFENRGHFAPRMEFGEAQVWASRRSILRASFLIVSKATRPLAISGLPLCRFHFW